MDIAEYEHSRNGDGQEQQGGNEDSLEREKSDKDTVDKAVDEVKVGNCMKKNISATRR